MTMLRVFQALPVLCASILFTACASQVPSTVPRSVAIAAGNCPQLAYPAQARLHEAVGTTEIEFEVSAQGNVTRVAIAKISGTTPGHRLLDATALETVKKCTFAPAPGFLSATSKVSYLWKLTE